MKALCLLLLLTVVSAAQQPAPKPAPAPAPKPAPAPVKSDEPKKEEEKDNQDQKVEKPKVETPVKKKTVEEVLKKCDAIEGLFTLHRDREAGSVYLFIKKGQLNREFIYFSHTVNGVVGADTMQGQFGDETVFVMKRNYEKIEFIEQNTAFYFDPANPLAKAAEANVSHAVLAAESIVAENAQGLLINAGNLFLKETLRQVKPSTEGENKALLGKLSDTKTKFVKLKSFPRNTLCTVEYVYENPAPPAMKDDDSVSGDVTDRRNISITIQHTFIAMPKNDYQPRGDDPRIGYFMTELTDQTSTDVTPYRDFIHRWDLKKKDPTAALSEPVKPIVWWMENTTPLEFREIIRESALKWNLAFEKIGFKNALVIKQQPDNAKWDSDDIQKNVLRWTSSPKPPFGGYGPSFVNPRTGQILGSDIMLELAFVKNRIFARRLWDEVGLAGMHAEHGQDDCSCMAASFTQQGLLFGTQMMRLRKAEKVEFDVLLKEALSQLVLHELGHTLGLNHNFRSSHLHSPAELQDRALTQKTGLSGSVMDYMPLNLGPDKAKQGQYYLDAPGAYDDWAIAYGYSVALPDAEAEAKRLEAIAGRSHEPQLAFANDADDMRSPGKSIDPRAMVGDLSDDPIAYGIGRCELVRQSMDQLLAEVPQPGTSWQELTQSYISLTTESSNALTAISRYIGGVYVERPLVGQVKENAPQPLRPVEVEKQKAAMQALAKYAFAPDAWQAPTTLLTHLQQQRRGFDFKSTGEDPKLHDRALKIQRALLDHLLHVNTQTRILDSALYGNAYLLHEMMRDLTQAMVAGEAAGAPINTMRQNLQLDYVERLLNLVKGKTHQPAIQSVALQQLRSVESQFKAQLPAAPEANQAHLGHVLYKIEQGLEAK
jgi:hypothetical protein